MRLRVLKLRGRKLVITLCVAALVVAGVAIAIGLTVGGADPSQSDEGLFSSAGALDDSTLTAFPWEIEDAPQIDVEGPAKIERGEVETLATTSWGSEEGEVGLLLGEGGYPMVTPLDVAVSPDGETVVLLDAVNSRVQIFSRDGQWQKSIDISLGDPKDIGFGADGEVYVLAYGGPLLSIDLDGQNLAEAEVAPYINPQELIVDGRTVWVRDIGSTTVYKVLDGGASVPVSDQLSTGVAGWPAGDTVFEVVLREPNEAACLVKDAITASALDVEIASAELPISEIRGLGTDAEGNFYLMARIWESGWSGTESWLFVGIAADGTQVGQLRLPLDFWAGGSWMVTPDGMLLEIRSTETGIQMIEHQLGGQQ